MMRIIDGGFILKNKEYDPLNDLYTFDIEGPEMPDCEIVNLCLNAKGDVWCEPQLIDEKLSEWVRRSLFNEIVKRNLW